MLKSVCSEIYKQIDFDKHISTFREVTNLTQELFTIYALYKRKLIRLINSTNKNKNTSSSIVSINNEKIKQYLPKNHDSTKELLLNNNFKTFCVNDVFDNEKINDAFFICKEIEDIITLRYNKKSRYEK
jgi:hypothetical protein